jgi:hypothetical protein
MANKKINQLVSKTAILSTDIFGIGDATTGQLFKKTIAELQAAIGGAVISVNGLVGTVVLDTDDIQELATPTNKYFTDARARGAISLTVTGNSGASTYSSGTGVLNVPTYTLAGLGGITATFLSGTSGISYNSTTGVISYSGTVYTDASIRALFSGATGISYNSSTGAISYSGTVYTDSSVRALISITTTGDSGASTYNNTTGVINVPNYTLAGLGGISYTSLSGGTGITYNNTTGAISYSGTVYTDASVRALISATGNISYNSTTGVISTSLTQYTDALARASVSLTTTGTSGASTYNSTTGVFNIPNYGSALSGYLPLTGGTLTGALGGTSATFSGDFTLTSAATGGVIITNNNNSHINLFRSSNPTANYGININGNGDLNIDETGVATRVTIKKTTGAATFSSSVTAKTGYFLTHSNATTVFRVEEFSGTQGVGLSMYNSSGVQNILFNAGGDSYIKGGNVGIGTTSPSKLLDIYSSGTTNTAQLVISESTSTNRLYLGTFSNGSYISLGGTYQGGWTTNGTNAIANIGMSASNGASTIQFETSATNAAGPTERMRITSGGNILMGTSSDNGERLYVSGSIRATGTITANSDIRIKNNITKIENALEKVGQISGYTYNTNYDDKRHGGVIAQEIDKVFPEIVNTGNDGLMGVEYGNISALLIEAIKEQNTKIKNLETLLASK